MMRVSPTLPADASGTTRAFFVYGSVPLSQVVVVFDGDAANTIKPTWAILRLSLPERPRLMSSIPNCLILRRNCVTIRSISVERRFYATATTLLSAISSTISQLIQNADFQYVITL